MIFIRPDNTQVNFCTVCRIEPEYYRGIKVSGYCGRHEPNITVEQVERLYGGGRFTLLLFNSDLIVVAEETININSSPGVHVDQECRPRLEELIDQNAQLNRDITELREQIAEIQSAADSDVGEVFNVWNQMTPRERREARQAVMQADTELARAFREQTERDHRLNQAQIEEHRQVAARADLARQRSEQMENMRAMFPQRQEQARTVRGLEIGTVEPRQHNEFSWRGVYDENHLNIAADSTPDKPEKAKPPRKLVRKLDIED